MRENGGSRQPIIRQLATAAAPILVPVFSIRCHRFVFCLSSLLDGQIVRKQAANWRWPASKRIKIEYSTAPICQPTFLVSPNGTTRHLFICPSKFGDCLFLIKLKLGKRRRKCK
jgi:hypothetical protein